MQFNKDIQGHDMHEVAGNLADCCSICSATKKCTAYAWKNDGTGSSGKCYLKKSKEPVIDKIGVTVATLD